MQEIFPKKYRSWLAGHWAERLAALYFRFRGYSVLRRRFKSPVGEIDVIVTKGTTVVFVEVKYRQTCELALFSITPYQRKRIIRAAQIFLTTYPQFEKIRFDVVVINRYYRLKHFKDAFLNEDNKSIL